MERLAPSLANLKRLNELLQTGLALPEAERKAWLAQLPPTDQALVPRLSDLLQRSGTSGHSGADAFLRAPLALPHPDPWADMALQDHAGDTVGPYRLMRELGQGGMACVWLAERIDGALQRQVALKLPHWGVAPGLAQRMALERDILAGLTHPRIARLYDAGLSRQGRPWLAMEFIEGAPIDEYCREQALSTRERVVLFLQVLDAVAHAHARLVVHRDLKPANILVDAAGDVRLLDFGVAKLLAEPSAHPLAQHPLTQHGGPLLTPDYASPEQAAGQVVGVATDVYSLGVVLYELLCGRRPYSLSTDATPLAARIAAAATPPASRQATDAATARALRGDLDAVLGKALEKEAARRYGSAEALSQDLRRYLDGEPVQAQRSSRVYRLRKFLQRHRFGVAATGAVMLSLAVGLGAALWQARAARVEAERAQAAKNFVASIFAQASPRQSGPVQTADLLDAAALRIEQELQNDPHTAAELGVMIGESYGRLGIAARGESVLRAAMARAAILHGPGHPLTVHSQRLLAQSLEQHLRTEEAARVAEAALPHALAGLPHTAEDAVELLQSRSFQVAKQDQAEAAYALLQQALSIGETHLGVGHPSTLTALGLLSNTYGRFYEYTRQLDAATLAMQRAQTALGTQRPNVTLTAIERWYAEALRRNDRPRDALVILRRVLADQRSLDGADTQRVRHAHYQLGLALGEAGDLNEAFEQLRTTVNMEAQHNPQDNEDRLAYGFALGTILQFAWRDNDAIEQYERMFELQRRLGAQDGAWIRFSRMRYARALAMAGRDHDAAQTIHALLALPDTGADLRLEAHTVLALNHRLQGRTQAAWNEAQRTWAAPSRETARPRQQAQLAAEWAAAALALGQPQAARQHATQALALYERAQVGVSPLSATAWLVQAQLDLAAGKVQGAHNALSALQAAWASANPGSPWQAEVAWALATAEDRMGRQGIARELRHRAAPLLAQAPVPHLKQLAHQRV